MQRRMLFLKIVNNKGRKQMKAKESSFVYKPQSDSFDPISAFSTELNKTKLVV